MAVIAEDPRHDSIVMLSETEEVRERIFSEWDMELVSHRKSARCWLTPSGHRKTRNSVAALQRLVRQLDAHLPPALARSNVVLMNIDGRGKSGARQAPQTRCDLESDGARVAVYQTGLSGAPLLLIHSINAAASVAEVEPLRARYGLRRMVYCVDLPGFGESDRSDRVYSPRLMTNAILTAARAIYAMNGKAIDALAVSLSCEFLARAANEQPSLFRTHCAGQSHGFHGNPNAAWCSRPEPRQAVVVQTPARPRVGTLFISSTDAPEESFATFSSGHGALNISMKICGRRTC